MRGVLLWLLLSSTGVVLAAPGSWSADGIGVTLQVRGVSASSPPLMAPATLPIGEGRVGLVSWRYSLLTPAPAGLQVQLCTMARCMALAGESGETSFFTGIAGRSEFWFVYALTGRGGVYPPLRVLSNQVLVNYR